MSPGLGNILIGHAGSRLDKVDSVHILNGGLPGKPVPPLGYVVTWSASDLIAMYSRRVTIVKEGKVTRVKALSGLEQITFPEIGRLEAFYTDGLRTLLRTVKGVREMWEKTLRYPGHVERIRLLQALGYFDQDPVQVSGGSVSPKELTARLFEKKLRKPEIPDIVAILIRVSGKENGQRMTYSYRILDCYDGKRKVTAMARTTAYTASVVTKLLAQGMIAEKGVVPPENIGMNEKLYSGFVKEMGKRGVKIQETTIVQD
jgi:saccharopine dehydrogenase-like NADP-dependent oxidoreductase